LATFCAIFVKIAVDFFMQKNIFFAKSLARRAKVFKNNAKFFLKISKNADFSTLLYKSSAFIT